MVNTWIRVWDGECCDQCGKSLKGANDVYSYEGHLFCSKECFGEYLAEKYEGDTEAVEFISWAEYKQMEAERKAEFGKT